MEGQQVTNPPLLQGEQKTSIHRTSQVMLFDVLSVIHAHGGKAKSGLDTIVAFCCETQGIMITYGNLITVQSTAAAKPFRPSMTPGWELRSAILALISPCTACQAASAASPSRSNAWGAMLMRLAVVRGVPLHAASSQKTFLWCAEPAGKASQNVTDWSHLRSSVRLATIEACDVSLVSEML